MISILIFNIVMLGAIGLMYSVFGANSVSRILGTVYLGATSINIGMIVYLLKT